VLGRGWWSVYHPLGSQQAPEDRSLLRRPRLPRWRLGFAAALLVAGVVASAAIVLCFGSPAQASGAPGGAIAAAQVRSSAETHSATGERGAARAAEPRRPAAARQSAPPAPSPWDAAVGAVGGVLESAGLALRLFTETSTTTTVTMTTSVTTTTATTTTVTTTTLTSTSTTVTTSTTKLCTLFCFAVVRTVGYEAGLMSALQQRQISIFACEDYAVYSNGGPLWVGSVQAKEIKSGEIKMGNMSQNGTTTTSWLNTKIFLDAWDLVFEDGRWWSHAWTVKVDPDAVFFPHRLQVRLYPYYQAGATDGPALYVANCDRSWNGEPYELKIFGSLEVFTRNAVGMYKAFGHRCRESLDWHRWGEDFFMQQCMNMLQVQAINGVSFMADNNCYPGACGDPTKVAYHAYKDLGSYLACWGQSNAAPPPTVQQIVAFMK